MVPADGAWRVLAVLGFQPWASLGVQVGGAVRVNCCWQHLLSVGGGAVVCGAERRNRVLYWLLTGRLVDVADHLERRRARALDAIRHAGRGSDPSFPCAPTDG